MDTSHTEKPATGLSSEPASNVDQLGGSIGDTLTPTATNTQRSRGATHILMHIIATMSDARQAFLDETTKLRDVGYDEEETADFDLLAYRLAQAITGLCHVMSPERHTSATREEWKRARIEASIEGAAQ